MSSPGPFRASAQPPSSNPSNRSFSLPARTTSRLPPTPASTNSSDGIETLFVCSNTKIVSFTAVGSSKRISPSRARKADNGTQSNIPWSTPIERTLAVGVLRIYRVTASNVSFLNSGTLLHTIFPRSQCWCVDDQSVFVLRIRQDSYYRMELPFETEEDKDKISLFKSVLGQVLQYEKTQCPFSRGFVVDEPERPKTPPRRRRVSQPGSQPRQKAKKWLFDKTWVPESSPRPSTPGQEGSDSGTTSSYEDDDRSSIHTDCSEVVPESPLTIMDSSPAKPTPAKSVSRSPSVAERASIFDQSPRSRSVTAPIRLDNGASLPTMERIPESPQAETSSLQGTEKPILERHPSDTGSLVSSVDSFYSVDETTHRTPSPSSPPFLDARAELLNPWAEHQQEVPRGRTKHRRQTSEVTVRAPSDHKAKSTPVTPTKMTESHPTMADPVFHPRSAPSTPPLISDSDSDSIDLQSQDVLTPPNAIRLRKLTGASQRRAFSPMPPAQNLFCPPKRTPTQDFTQALVRRTYELVLGPPAHLVSLMLRIAQSISNGFGFSTYRVRRAEKIPCSWESDDEGNWSDEDDFGIPLNTLGDPVRTRGISGGVD